MNLQERKISFVQEFLRIQNEGVISELEIFLKKSKSNIYKNNLEPMSLEKFHQEIDQSLNDSENDRVIKSVDLKSKYV